MHVHTCRVTQKIEMSLNMNNSKIGRQFKEVLINFTQTQVWDQCVPNLRIKSVSCGYSCDEEDLEEFNKETIFKYSSLLAVLPRNKLDPTPLQL